MKTRKQKAIALLIALCLLPLLSFAISYYKAEHTAIKYLRVLDIYDTKSFEGNKDLLYKITGDKVFISKYSGTVYQRILYKVLSIKCVKVKGFRSFVFEVRLVINKVNYLTCHISIDRGKVVDAHRKD